MYSLNIELRSVGFHETPILNKNCISILCLGENLDKGNPLMFVDFYFVVLILVKPVFTLHGMSGELIWTQYGSAYVIFRQYILECLIHAF